MTSAPAGHPPDGAQPAPSGAAPSAPASSAPAPTGSAGSADDGAAALVPPSGRAGRRRRLRRLFRSERARRVGADLVYVVVGGIDVVQGMVQQGQKHGGWWALAVLALTTPPLVVLVRSRRTHPLWPLFAALPAAAAGFTQVLVPLAVLSLAIRRRDWVLPAAAFGGWALMVVGGLRQDLTGPTIGGGIVTLLAVAAGAYVGARRDLLASLRERAEQAEATALLLQRQARLSERTRIAREMHDVVAHRISLVALHAGALEVNPRAGAEQVEKAASLIGSTARQALDDLRGVLGVLRSDPDAPADEAGLAPQPRLEDVPRLVEASAAAGVPVAFEDHRPDDAPPVDDVVGRTVYRVVQEALTNVHKHAGPASTRVVLATGESGGLVVEVTNVRPVAPPAAPLVPGAGAGLVGLRERVALAGGWRVRAAFPGRAA